MIDNYIRPGTMAETLRFLSQAAGQARPLAGGTDLLLKQDKNSSTKMTLVDISAVPELVGITSTSDGLSIGSATCLAEISRSSLLTGCLHVLSVAAKTVGSSQIRHLATVGGNLCNASPSADMIPPLLVLEAELSIASLHESRSMPLDDFFLGPGQTRLKDDELLVSIKVNRQPPGAVAVFLKHAPRGAMDLAIASVAVKMWNSNDHLQVRIALGAVAPTPLRAFLSEKLLASSPTLDDETFRAVARSAAGVISPISDVRASADYRRAMVETLTFRSLHQAYAMIQQQA